MIEETASRQQIRTLNSAGLSRPSRGRSPVLSRVAMNQVTTNRWSLLDDVFAYRDAGFGAIGVWRPKLAEFGEERGIELIRDCGLSVSSLSWAGGFTGANGHSFRQSMDDTRDALEVAGKLAAECLVVVSGARAGHTFRHARRLLLSALTTLGDLAAEQGVTLALQPMHQQFSRDWTFLNTIEATLDVLGECDHPRIRMAFDVYHLWQEPQLLERIPRFARQVAAVRLSDWRHPPRSDFDRCLPGDGRIPLAEIVRAFLDSGYRGFFEVEIWSEELWSSDYDKLLRECFARLESLEQTVAAQ